MRKHPNSHREAKATAPVLDSTLCYTQNPSMSEIGLLSTVISTELLGCCRTDLQMTHRNNSREEWKQDIVERQHNLTPAEITRASQFRASGLPRSAPLPIAVRWIYVCVGAALLALGIGVRVAFDKPLVVVSAAFGAVGLLVMLSAVRWTAKK